MLNISANIDDFERSLSDVARKQLPFAVALALNDTAADVKEAWGVHVERRLDRPTPFTKRGTYVRRASKTRLRARIGYKDIQSGYLRWQVEGGMRRPSGRAILVPVGQRKNKYGNMPRRAVANALAKPDTFVASKWAKQTRHLAPGIYKRPRRGKYSKQGVVSGYGNKNKGKLKGPQLLVSFEDRASYSKRIDIDRVAMAKARAAMPRHFAKRFMHAMATAK